MDRTLQTQAINAAIVNISGRQRMLSQRSALFCMRLVCSQDAAECETLRQALREIVALMEQSHSGLIYGNVQLNLPGHPSAIVRSMYFEPPLNLDQQVKSYLANVSALLDDRELTLDNPKLKIIIDAASTALLTALNKVVSQYQRESEAEQQLISAQQFELYQQSCSAAETAQNQAKQLQQALVDLHQAQTKLIQSEKMSSLGQLVAGVAHEINNPATFIRANLPHLQENVINLLEILHLYQKHCSVPIAEIEAQSEKIDLEFLQTDLPKILTSLRSGVDRIDQIVLSLRNFSRMDEADCKIVDIHDGIESTLLMLQHRLQKSSAISVIKNYGILPPVECFASSLNQVFFQLLTNAIDALEASPNPAQITIQTQKIDPEWVEITIADNGSGIPKSIQQQIFDPFFTTKPIGEGTGMGLAICYQIIVEKHRGKIVCSSTPDVETIFVIQIPTVQRSCDL
ncbi:MAG TPA: ATP-binding protein [Leptolyngbya sp.]|nr:ATP-binding protein [Leptolyngbya sp.]